jgi:hypothetical protein
LRRERRIEATVETETLLVVRKGAAAVGWCEACGAEVALLTPLAAARAARVSTRLVYAGIEAGRVHFTERPDGTLLVCAPSAGASGLK